MLEQLGDRVVLVAAGDTGGARHTDFGQPVFELNRFQRGRALAAKVGIPSVGYRLPELRKEIARLEVDTALIHYGPTGLLLEPLLGPDLNAWVHFHGYDAMFDMRRAEPPHERVHTADYQAKIVQLAKRAGFIANSEFTASVLRGAGTPPSRVRVKTLGVPVININREPRSGPIMIAAVGRMIDCKGPDFTVRAFIRACELGLQGSLTIVGSGPMLAECERLATASTVADRIHLVGSVPNQQVQALLAEADVFTQHNLVGPKTGQIEAFGVSVLEGMAAAMATVTTTNGGVNEIVLADETTLVFPEGDVESQARAFLLLEQDPELRHRLGVAGQRRARESFSLEQEGEKLLDILSQKPQ